MFNFFIQFGFALVLPIFCRNWAEARLISLLLRVVCLYLDLRLGVLDLFSDAQEVRMLAWEVVLL